jgi:hypothetical protein
MLLFIQPETLTPFILAAWAVCFAALSWLFKQVIQQGKEHVELRTAFKYYLETQARGAARVLDSPNPTPLEMRLLLQKYVDGQITDAEQSELVGFLRAMKDDQTIQKSERSAAIQLLASISTLKRIAAA